MIKHAWIPERLAQMGKNQQGLAEHLGLPHSRISDIVHGRRLIKITELEAVADYLQLTTTRIINEFTANDGTTQGE